MPPLPLLPPSSPVSPLSYLASAAHVSCFITVGKTVGKLLWYATW